MFRNQSVRQSVIGNCDCLRDIVHLLQSANDWTRVVCSSQNAALSIVRGDKGCAMFDQASSPC